MPSDLRAAGFMLLISVAATAAESPPPDMNLIEFLGSVDVGTKSASGTEVLTVIDADLLPDSPEEPLYE